MVHSLSDFGEDVLYVVLGFLNEQGDGRARQVNKAFSTLRPAWVVGRAVRQVEAYYPGGRPILRNGCAPLTACDALAFSPDGSTLAVGIGTDTVITLYDVPTGERRRELERPGGERIASECVEFSPDGNTLAVLGEVEDARDATVGYPPYDDSDSDDPYDPASHIYGLVALYATVDDELRYEIRVPAEIYAIAFSPDSRTLALGFNDNVSLYDAATGELRRTFEPRNEIVWTAAFSPDGTTLAIGGGHGLGPPTGGTVKIFDVGTGEESREYVHSGPVRDVAFSPDGASLAIGGHHHTPLVSPSAPRPQKGMLALWDLAIGETRSLALADVVQITRFSCDGILAVGGRDEKVTLYDAATLKVRREFVRGIAVDVAAFSPDGTSLALGGRNGTVSVFDVATGALRRKARS